MTFDAWEVAIRPPEDYLMHYRTKGSKNGVRRYQAQDGTWTELGLQERRKREGFGESRKERKAAKKAAKSEHKAARQEARRAAAQQFLDRRRKKNIKNLTDDELKQRIARVKMEAEYKELTRKNSNLLQIGANIVGKYLEYKTARDERVFKMNQQKIERERLATERLKAKEATKQAKYGIETAKANAEKAEHEADKTKADVKGGLKIQRKNELKKTKLEYRRTTVHGGVGEYINKVLTGKGRASAKVAEGTVLSKEIRKSQKILDRYNRKPRNKNHKIYISDDREKRYHDLEMAREKRRLEEAKQQKQPKHPKKP